LAPLVRPPVLDSRGPNRVHSSVARLPRDAGDRNIERLGQAPQSAHVRPGEAAFDSGEVPRVYAGTAAEFVDAEAECFTLAADRRRVGLE